MTTPGASPFRVRLCPDCHRPMWSKHMEVCSGPAQRIADPPSPPPSCDCVGWLHEADCYLVVDGEPAA